MKQLILPDYYSGEELFQLPEDDSHYLINVQRREIGYTLNLLDKNGQKYRGTIVDIVDGICQLSLKPEDSSLSDKTEFILFQAIPKGKKIDLMIRQSVEAGISSIVPVMADHSIPQFKTVSDQEKKRERWNKIIKEASQQSGTGTITQLEPLQSMEDALKNLKKPYTGIFFHQVPMKNRPLHSLLSTPEKRIVIVIGPEGGLSPQEVDLLEKYDFNPALLGENILRAETATTFAIGAVQMITSEREFWKEV